MRHSILYSCISHVGNIRKINQDNFICGGRYMEPNDGDMKFPLCGTESSKGSSVFGIFDGMGGEERGEMASYIAAKDAAVLEIGKDAVAALSQFCQRANTDICDYANRNEISSMGTTAAMLAFTDSGITLCNIGDSKIFRFCDGVLEQISKDHVSVAAFGVKPPLSQNLGIPPTELIIDPYLAQGAYNDGDIYLICSDGLTDMVPTEEIVGILTSRPVEEACTGLLEKALSHGGRDNITMILCRIERESGWLFKRRKRKRDKNDS